MSKVLVAEDDHDIAEPLARALRREGHEVEVFSDGPGALEAARSGTADLLVLDLGLPGMDGLDVCRALRAGGHDLPVLVLTARNDEVDAVVGLDAGADDYVTKPFRLAELLGADLLLDRRPLTNPVLGAAVRRVLSVQEAWPWATRAHRVVADVAPDLGKLPVPGVIRGGKLAGAAHDHLEDALGMLGNQFTVDWSRYQQGSLGDSVDTGVPQHISTGNPVRHLFSPCLVSPDAYAVDPLTSSCTAVCVPFARGKTYRLWCFALLSPQALCPLIPCPVAPHRYRASTLAPGRTRAIMRPSASASAHPYPPTAWRRVGRARMGGRRGCWVHDRDAGGASRLQRTHRSLPEQGHRQDAQRA